MGKKEFELKPVLYMQLSRKILSQLDPATITVPSETLFSLPEKVLQFGTGCTAAWAPGSFD